jgi:flagellar FliL protein
MAKTKVAAVDETGEVDGAASGGRRKLVIGLVLVVLLGACAWWFMLRPAAAEAEPVPGEVVPLEAIQVNLADGHYLRIGIALQATEDAHEIDGSAALDATIAMFSGRSQEQLSLPQVRSRLKTKLGHQLEEAYHGDVMEVFFTDFVTQ